MSTDVPAALVSEAADGEADTQTKRQSLATALRVLFAAAAVLLASFVAVVTGLV